jgi:hypothetical protein
VPVGVPPFVLETIAVRVVLPDEVMEAAAAVTVTEGVARGDETLPPLQAVKNEFTSMEPRPVASS